MRGNEVISSIPAGWQAYRANQVIEVSFQFNTAVVVDGSVTATMLVGLQNGNWDEARREAQYLRGSGSETLVFGYTVRPGDVDRKGIGIAAGGENFGFGGNGAIRAKGTNVAAYPHYLGKDHYSEHKVDTAIPSISSVAIESRPSNGEAYAAGETISVAVTFGEEITLTGDPYIELDIGGVARQATLTSAAPRSTSAQERRFSKKLVFQYQVTEADSDNDGVGISANSLKLNGGGIFDWAGNAAGQSHSALAADSKHKVGGAS